MQDVKLEGVLEVEKVGVIPETGNLPEQSSGKPLKSGAYITEELIAIADGYLEQCVDIPIFKEDGSVAYVDVKLPTIAGLSQYMGVPKSTMLYWRNKAEVKDENELYKKFGLVYDRVLVEQEIRLINKSMGGMYKEKTAALLLGKLGYSEETKTTHLIGVAPLSTEQQKKLDALL